MNKKTLLLSLLAMFISIASIDAYAYDIAVENGDGITIYYNFYNEGEELEVAQNPVNKYSGTIRIPETVTYGTYTRKVTSIGGGAFFECSELVSVIIPNSVTAIGGNAFGGCSALTSIVIPNGVNKIEELTFQWCEALKSIIIPNSVTSIGHDAFAYCTGLESVTIPNSVELMASHVFFNCHALVSINIPNSVTVIGSSAFQGCSSLSSIIIPSSVTSIYDYTFYGCSNLTSVTIPNSVTTIGEKAFYGCSGLTAVHITDLEAWCKIVFSSSYADANGSNPLTYAHHLLLNGTEIKDLVIPNGVTSINRNAFNNCSDLRSVIIPNSVTIIDDYAFYNCDGLKSLAIPNSVKTIGNATFAWCNNLATVDIPNSVTSLGEGVFAQCHSLNSITIPNSITSISKESFYWCVNLNSVIIPSDVTYIGVSAFEGCNHLTSLTLPLSLTGIDKSAFSGCNNLSSIAIPKSVNSIGRYAFYNCDNLMSVTSMITDPFVINSNVFGQNTKDNGTLLVPFGTIEKYKATEGWNSFVSIMEHKGTCETPTISYNNGKLTFNCATEGATCISSISDTDVATYNTNEVQLNVTYNINVYATKEGYNNSETATATLCWIEQEPKAEGDINEIAEVKAYPLLIQSRENKIVISGADDGTDIRVYNISGSQIGFAQSRGRQAVVDADLPKGSVAIVKVGNNVVKVILQ